VRRQAASPTTWRYTEQGSLFSRGGCWNGSCLGGYKSINDVLSGSARHGIQAIIYQVHWKIVSLPSLFFHFLIFPDRVAFAGVSAYVDTFTKSSFSHQCSQVRKRTETLALFMLVGYLTSQISIMEHTALIYLAKQIPAGAFANIRIVFCMWNFFDYYDTKLTMDCHCEYLMLLQLNHRKIRI